MVALSINRQIANKSNVNEKCTRTRCLPWTYWIKGYTRLHIEQYDYFSPAAIWCIHNYICAVVFVLSFLLSSVCFLNPYVLVRLLVFSFSLGRAPSSMPCYPLAECVCMFVGFVLSPLSLTRSLALCHSVCVAWMRIQSSISFRHFITHWISSSPNVSAPNIFIRYTCIMCICFVSPILVGRLVG